MGGLRAASWPGRAWIQRARSQQIQWLHRKGMDSKRKKTRAWEVGVGFVGGGFIFVMGCGGGGGGGGGGCFWCLWKGG
ncbi:hypothetical protein BO71DRAFT_402863 [Aspergillus ellipticus CBS 707.79]|uniref:Uncharacterized protein n=1 Tax=Aspergillus ellipticus CBS 707.79 TaxID=1448320 RepID=A0A319CX79_9EURO|nr:hypothetical protein BO71DRAFT_402863 [Aspergillus ellipticus CBS 707.79]